MDEVERARRKRMMIEAKYFKRGAVVLAFRQRPSRRERQLTYVAGRAPVHPSPGRRQMYPRSPDSDRIASCECGRQRQR